MNQLLDGISSGAEKKSSGKEAEVYNNLFWPGAIMVWWPGLQHYERLKGDCVAKNGSAYFFCSGATVSYPFTVLISTPAVEKKQNIAARGSRGHQH